jgi:tetratricopeptide (TPR) repeat protein
LVAVLLATPAVAVADDPPEPKPPTTEELVADLGDPVFGVREKAQRELWQRGKAAVPALERAAKGSDPEAARRAKELLDKFAWGILPDASPEVLKLVREFRSGDPNPERNTEVRKRAITELLKKGRTGASVVGAILKKDLSDARAQLTATVTAVVRHEVPLLLAAGKTADADDLIALHATGTTPGGAGDYASYHTLRGDLPAAITSAEALFESGHKTKEVRLLLVHLYRAAGQWEKAREFAADLPPREDGASYKETLLEDENDWVALANLPPDRDFNHASAVRFTLLRLSGRADKLDAEVKKLRADAEELSAPNDVLDATVALLSNHRAEAATELLLEKKKNLALLSEILIARMRYKEALDLIGSGKTEKEAISADERRDFNLRRARVLVLTGHPDDAVQLFASVADALVHSDQKRVLTFTPAARALVRTELRLGLRDLACEHAALFADAMREGGSVIGAQGESPYELLLPNDPIAAETLFGVLRANKVPGDEPGPTMLRVRELLTGTAGNAAVDQAVTLLRESAAGLAPGVANLLKARRYFALAQVCRAAKRGDVAEAAFKVAAELTASAEDAADAGGARSWVYGAPDPARVWIEWGEFLTDSGRYRDAAAVFEAGWKLYPDQPLPLFLSGQALVKAGAAKGGGQRIELAHWVSLGNEKLRGRFLDELVRRGESKAIRREVALILKACWSHDHFFGNVMNQCARGSALVGDFATAEMCGQRSLLVVLRHPGVYFVDTAGYLNVPHDLLVFHARALLKANKVNEAMAAARAVLAVTPGHLELVTGVVPELDRHGRKKEADELFDLAWGAYQKILTDYPNSPSARHALATLAGHCQRKLDDGLKYAKAAVASDPGSPAYREALAEVYFRRSARDEAVKIAQKLVDEQPRNALYRRQLARYHSAPFDSPWPYTTE